MTIGAGNVEFQESNIAAPWFINGCAVIPIQANGTKAPIFAWKEYQASAPTADLVAQWFERQYPRAGVAVICGSVSGNLEMLELEGRSHNDHSLSLIAAACDDAGIASLWQRLLTIGYSETTPSGGLHLLYRVLDHPVPRNTKIASRYAAEEEYTDEERDIQERRPSWLATRVLVETRGEGGYVIVAPTPGTCHPTGLPWVHRSGSVSNFLQLTWEQREQLHAAIRLALNEIYTEVAAAEFRPPKPAPIPGVLSAADDFDLRASWEDEWFTSQGWKVHHREGAELYWTRPGKDTSDGHSATTGYAVDGDRLYIWSTSTDLPSEQPLSKFFVFAHYRFNGQLRTAAQYLRTQGYGTSLIAPIEYADFDLAEDDAEQADAEDGEIAARPQRPLDRRHRLESVAEQARDQGGMLFTDVGYARRMFERYGTNVRFNHVDKHWYIWQVGDTCWMPDEGGTVEQLAETIALDSYDRLSDSVDNGQGNEKKLLELFRQARNGLNQTKLATIIARFKNQPNVTIGPEAFDNNMDLLNLSNGTLNLITKEIWAHSPKDMLTLTFGASYDPTARCPRFLQFIEDVFPDPSIRSYVQRALGYSLTGRPSERVMFMLHGPSGTGKSVLTGVMTGVFGDYGTTAPATTFRLKKNETTVDLHQLRGKRFVATSEMPEGAQLDEELMKRVTGGDMLTSRALYESFHHWRARCVVWIATNFLPRLSSDDNAIWRRAKTIPMRTEFGPHANTEIKGLTEQLLQERDGILNWLLDGLDSYQSSKGLAEPVSVVEDITSYRTDMDSVASWFREATTDGTVVVDAGAHVPTQLLYQLYVGHCNDEGVQPLGRRRFTKRLSGMSGRDGEAKKVGGVRVWVGLKHQGGP